MNNHIKNVIDKFDEEFEAHKTEEGYCCACMADLVVFEGKIQKTREEVQMTKDGKYISYKGKVYVYKDEKFKELKSND